MRLTVRHVRELTTALLLAITLTQAVVSIAGSEASIEPGQCTLTTQSTAT